VSKYLKQNTACHIMFGVFVDKTNGVDLEVGAGIITSIDHATTGIFLSKNGAAGAIRHQGVTASVLDAYGMFQVHLDATDTDTVGNLRVMMAEAATFLPVWDDYVVLPANVYDALMGTDLLDISIVQVNGAAQTATLDTLKTAVDAVAVWASAAISKSYTAGAISDIRGDSWSIPMPSLTLDTNKQQFMIKYRATDLDADAILFVDSTTGLKTLNGVSTGLTASDATLVYVGTTLTLTLKASVTALLPVGVWDYGIQYVTAAGLVEEPYGGNFTITADIVQATS
jgi:hypothetical protein